MWYKLATIYVRGYPRRLFSQDWDAKPRTARLRSVCGRLVDDLFIALHVNVDKAEWLEDREKGDI